MPGEPVVRDRLPRRGVADELPDARPDAGVVVERAEADADRIGVGQVARVDVGAADATEELLAADLGLPAAQHVLAGDDPERAFGGMGARRDRRAGATLAALAVAIARLDEGCGHLEPDGAAVAAAGEWEVGHG